MVVESEKSVRNGELPTLYVSLVLFRSFATHGRPVIERALSSLLSQEDFTLNKNLFIVLIQNGREEKREAQEVSEHFGIHFVFHETNLGFAAAQNGAVKTALEKGSSYFLTFNPDLDLEPDALSRMVRALEEDPSAGSATPTLYRADSNLNPVKPLRYDGTGMTLTPSLRHFDRFSEQPAQSKSLPKEYVFGGTGACLLMRQDFLQDVSLIGEEYDKDLFLVYPELKAGQEERLPLFDEALFAYRDDADLAWRGGLLGWKCLYVPEAKGYHKRIVTPEVRTSLPSDINAASVRNRFLLQLNNYSLSLGPASFFKGLILRNLLVLVAVLFIERTSLKALKEVWLLKRRALERRRILFNKRKQRCLTNKILLTNR